MAKLVAWLQGKKTIITLGVTALFSVLVALGQVTPEASNEAAAQVGRLLEQVLGILGTLASIAGIFASMKGNRIEADVKKQTGGNGA